MRLPEAQKILKQDCEEKGYGRKKWWAENLGVHQQTISYWIHGHRRPSGKHLEKIKSVASILGSSERAEIWYEHLLTIYFERIRADREVVKEIVKNILQAETVGVRCLALLSVIVEAFSIEHIEAGETLLRNRIGWLLEVSGKEPSFSPIPSSTMPLVKLFGPVASPVVTSHLETMQTAVGWRWHLYDSDIGDIKRSFVDGYLRSGAEVPKSA